MGQFAFGFEDQPGVDQGHGGHAQLFMAQPAQGDHGDPEELA
jgi:hypothetical protein